MATQTVVTCDVHGDGITPAETITFGVDGNSYEVDLCEPHAAELRGGLQRYVEVARSGGGGGGRRASGRTRRSAGRAPASGNLSAIREWARGQGYEVSTRGRIPAEITKAYAAAQRGGGRRGRRS